MRVTFDSNTYRRVVDPTQFSTDPSNADYQKVHAALKSGQTKGFLCETLATLEGILRAERGPYFSKSHASTDVSESDAPEGGIAIRLNIGPDDSRHPGLHRDVQPWVGKALSLGFRFMYAPRIGIPRPPELLGDVFVQERDPTVQARRLSRFSDLLEEIEKRGLGIAIARTLGESINARLGRAGQPWYRSLDQTADVHERNRVIRAVGEWADGDTVAAHYAYEHDYLCSEDFGRSAGGSSIFDRTGREWLTADYGIQFASISELARMT